MSTQTDFLATLQGYYKLHARHDLPWRLPEADGSFDSYKILVSELMLQQTQVSRVIPKYQAFITQFPSATQLAAASVSEVLVAWSGLGYNRRAKYLHQAARQLSNLYEPWAYEDLIACMGIGPNTAAAVLAYSYDLPVIFIETNIRTVLLHHFFADREDISDKEIISALEDMTKQVFVSESPREFYWALMDYGTYLKSTVGNTNRRSKTYTKQSKFIGSRREVRGKIIKALLGGPKSYQTLAVAINDDRFEDVLAMLEREQLVSVEGSLLMLYNEYEKKHNH